MRSRTTRSFWQCFARLPEPVQRQARRAFHRWRQNSRHPSLAFKRVHASEPIYSVRVSRGYRALGLRDDDLITWFWIGSHADYDRTLRES